MPTENLKTGPSIYESPKNLVLRDALAETLSKARDEGIELYLTGGTAAAIYGGESRALSLDLDFFVKEQDRERLESLFNGRFQVFLGKKLFKSDKLVGVSENGVDLDFIVAQNIVPDESLPDQRITLHLSGDIAAACQIREFLGVEVKVLPPELILLAKLFAGRGEDLGKYDLVDSSAMLENCEIDTSFLGKLITLLSSNNREIKSLLRLRLDDALCHLSKEEAGAETARSQQIERIKTLINRYAGNQIN